MIQRILLILLLTRLLIGCANIPPEAPQLSAELGQRITALETANLNLLQRFFALKKSEIDKFIEDEWVPTFAKEVFSNPQIKNSLKRMIEQNKNQEKLQFTITLATKLQQKINQKRRQLIAPLESIEAVLTEKVRDEYALAKAINTTLTNFLISSAELTENRNRYLNKISLNSENLNPVINEIDTLIENLLIRAENVENNVEKTQQYLEKIRKIKQSLLNKK